MRRAALLRQAPRTFDTREDGEAWLTDRTLKPRTRDHYARLLDNQIIRFANDANRHVLTARPVELEAQLGRFT